MWAEMDVDGDYGLALWAYIGRRENVWAIDALTYNPSSSQSLPVPIPRNWHVVCMGESDE